MVPRTNKEGKKERKREGGGGGSLESRIEGYKLLETRGLGKNKAGLDKRKERQYRRRGRGQGKSNTKGGRKEN